MSKRAGESAEQNVEKRPLLCSVNDATDEKADDSDDDCTIIPPDENESAVILIESDPEDETKSQQTNATTSAAAEKNSLIYSTCSCLRPNCIFCIPEKTRKIIFKIYNAYPMIDPSAKIYANIAANTNVPAVLVTRIFNLHHRSLNQTSKKKPFGDLTGLEQMKKLVPLEIAYIRRRLMNTKPHKQQNVLLQMWRHFRCKVTAIDFLSTIVDSGNISYRKVRHRLTKRESLNLVETNSLRCKRLEFIQQIQEYRTEPRPIIYVHELNPVDGSQNTMIFLAASAEKPIATAYLKNANIKTFIKWLSQNVLNTVTKPAVVVLTEPSVFQKNVVETDVPELKDTKAKMMEWLRKENISFKEDLFKIELYDLIQQNNRQRDTKPAYVLDAELKKLGHDVLYIPRENCDLNPLEYVLMHVKLKSIAKADGRFDLNTELHGMSHTKWAECFQRAERDERDYLDIEAKFNVTKKNYLIDNAASDVDCKVNSFLHKYTPDLNYA